MADTATRLRRGWVSAARGVLVRPALWPVALRQARRSARAGWWHRPPFLPVPDPAYLGFRLETQYGDDGAVSSDDLVRYLEWCRDEDRAIAASRHGGRR